MGQSTHRAPARELLEANHQVPGSYVIKAFGPMTASFRAGVEEAARLAVGTRAQFSERVGSKGKSMCVTIELEAQTVDEVIATYERLHDVPELKMIL